MRPDRKFLMLSWILCLGSLSDFTEAKGRAKRELRFPKGSSFAVAVALASFLPKGPTDGLAHVLEFDLGFPFPDRFAIDKKKSQKKIWGNPQKKIGGKNWYKIKSNKYRGKRSLKAQERENLMLKIEDYITRMGFNGTSCASRLQCELQNISPENSLLEELLFVLLQPSSEPDEKKCKEHSTTCPISLLQIIMHSQQIPSSHLV